MRTYPPIPLVGELCQHGSIALSWPDPSEFDRITELRNRSEIRRWFLDDRAIDEERNRLWLTDGMCRPQEALLSIRWKGEFFLGIVGWTNWDPTERTASFGRLALDRHALADLLTKGDFKSFREFGIAVEATCVLRDFAFQSMNLARLNTYYIQGNALAARVNKLVGMVECSTRKRLRLDGSELSTVELSLDYPRWRHLVSQSRPAGEGKV